MNSIMALLEKGSQLPVELERKLSKIMQNFNESSGLPYMVKVSYGWDFRPAQELANLDDCVNRADDRMYDMKSGKLTLSRLSGRAQEELGRRLGSAKQRVFILSAMQQEDLSSLFDADYLIVSLNTPEEALPQLAACDETALLLVDGRPGLQFVKGLPDALRQNLIPVLLCESEEADMIAEAFALGIADVLVRPYGTVLNRHRIKCLCQMNVTNRKLFQMLEQQDVL